MNKVVFSSWGGRVVDNRQKTEKYASVENLELPLQYDGHQLRAFMSWNGLVASYQLNLMGY